MSESDFREWLQLSNQSLMKEQRYMLYYQIFLTFTLVLYVVRWLPMFWMIICLLVAVAIYKRSFDELAYINMTLYSLEDNLPLENDSWYYKDPRYPSGVMLLKTNLAQLINYNNYLGYRILIYILLAIVWYYIS